MEVIIQTSWNVNLYTFSLCSMLRIVFLSNAFLKSIHNCIPFPLILKYEPTFSSAQLGQQQGKGKRKKRKGNAPQRSHPPQSQSMSRKGQDLTHPVVATTEVVAQPCPTLRPHEQQHARLSCPSLSPRACSHSCISSATSFSFCPQSFLVSRSFTVNRLFI